MRDFLVHIVSFLQSLNWAQPSWDLILVMFFAIATLIYGFSVGRERIVAILVSIYVTMAIVSYAPYITNTVTEIKIGNMFAFQITTFVSLFALLFFFLSQSALLKHVGSASHGGIIQSMIFSVLHVGLLTSVILSYLPDSAMQVFSNPIKTVFVTDIAKAIWVTAPIVVMALVRGPKEEHF